MKSSSNSRIPGKSKVSANAASETQTPIFPDMTGSAPVSENARSSEGGDFRRWFEGKAGGKGTFVGSPFVAENLHGRKDPSHWEKVLEEARAQADGILRKAQEKADHIEREAYQRGYAQGEKTGIEIAEERFKTAIQSLGSALKDFNEATKRRIEESESEIIRLVLAIARKVVHAEALCNENLVFQNLSEVLKNVAGREAVVVRLNPKDAERMLDAQRDLLEKFPEMKHLSFEPDDSIARGGAVIETNFGDLDARLEAQLEKLERSMMETLERREEESRQHEAIGSQRLP